MGKYDDMRYECMFTHYGCSFTWAGFGSGSGVRDRE